MSANTVSISHDNGMVIFLEKSLRLTLSKILPTHSSPRHSFEDNNTRKEFQLHGDDDEVSCFGLSPSNDDTAEGGNGIDSVSGKIPKPNT